MKGLVFTSFSEMIEAKFGLEFWDQMIEETNPMSGGIYTSAASYEMSELVAYLVYLNKKTEIPIPDLIYTFGRFLLNVFASNFPDFFQVKDLKTFLKNVESYIHIEVLKLYPTAGLPHFYYSEPDENTLIMNYRSSKKLYKLAEGLIEESAVYFKEEIELNTKPNSDGSVCKFTIRFLS